jgi:hypothetical protein
VKAQLGIDSYCSLRVATPPAMKPERPPSPGPSRSPPLPTSSDTACRRWIAFRGNANTGAEEPVANYTPGQATNVSFSPLSAGDWTRRNTAVYRKPLQIQDGGVLVVGAGNSGAEIAVELAPHHRTWLAGPDTGEEPTRAGSLPDRLLTPLMWFVATRFTVNTPPGRKLRNHFLDPPRGIPLGRVRRKDFAHAGIERVPRVTGVADGLPVLEDGRVLEVANVIWCTGLRPDYYWLDIPVPSRYGAPANERGVVEACPGLYTYGPPLPPLDQLGTAGRRRPGRRLHRRSHRATSEGSLGDKRGHSRE